MYFKAGVNKLHEKHLQLLRTLFAYIVRKHICSTHPAARHNFIDLYRIAFVAAVLQWYVNDVVLVASLGAFKALFIIISSQYKHNTDAY